MSEFRIEHDSMGEVRVPVGAKWRAQTQRAVENFPVSGRPLEPSHIAALGLIKAAAAEVNAELGVLEKDLAEAIARPRPTSRRTSTTTSSRSTSSRPAPAPRPT